MPILGKKLNPNKIVVASPLNYPRVRILLHGNDTSLWMISNHNPRLYRVKGGIIETFTFQEDFFAYCAVSGENEKIYLGTNCGLILFDGENFTLFNKENSGIQANEIISMRMDTKGRLHMLFLNQRFYTVYDGKNWESFTGAKTRQMVIIGVDMDGRVIIEDDKGILWMKEENKELKSIKRIGGEQVNKHTYGFTRNDQGFWVVLDKTIVCVLGNNIIDKNIFKIKSDCKGIDLGLYPSPLKNGIAVAADEGLTIISNSGKVKIPIEPFMDLRREENNHGAFCTDGNDVVYVLAEEGLIKYSIAEDKIEKIISITQDIPTTPKNPKPSNGKKAKTIKNGYLPMSEIPPSVLEVFHKLDISEEEKDALINLLRPAIAMKWKDVSSIPISLGASKWGGLPDLPKSIEWPEDEHGENHLPFLMQINLEEITHMDLEGLLPKRGWIYFFCDTSPDEIYDSKVLYFNGDIPELSPREIPDGLEEQYEDNPDLVNSLQTPQLLEFYLRFTLPPYEWFTKQNDPILNWKILPLHEIFSSLEKVTEGEDSHSVFTSQLLGWQYVVQQWTDDQLLLQINGKDKVEFKHWCSGDGVVQFFTNISKKDGKLIIEKAEAEMSYS